MGDMGDDFRAMREDRRKKHQKWYRMNKEVIDKSGIDYIDKDEALTTPLKATFYPSTGRWTYKGKTFSGGAKAFVNWYQNHEKNT